MDFINEYFLHMNTVIIKFAVGLVILTLSILISLILIMSMIQKIGKIQS